MWAHLSKHPRAPYRSLVSGLFAALLPALLLTEAVAGGGDARFGVTAISNAATAAAPSDIGALSVGFSRSYRFNGLSGLRSIIPTVDGGVIGGGYTHQNLTNQTADVLLTRLDSMGNRIWSKYPRYATGATQLVWYGHNVAPTSDGAYIMSAVLQTNFNFAPRVMKFDDAGTVLWSKQYLRADADSLHQLSYVLATVPTTDGGAVILSAAASATDTDVAAVIRLDSAGEPVWHKALGSTAINHVANSLKRLGDGNYVGSGYVRYANGNNDAWVFKIDGSGALLWSTRIAPPFAGAGIPSDTIATDIVEASDGMILVSGRAQNNTTTGNILKGFVAKVDSSGVVQWKRTYARAGEDVLPFSSAPTGDGGAVIVGNDTNGNGFATRINSAGDVIWSKRYNPGANHLTIAVVPGGYLIGGQRVYSLGGAPQVDAQVTRIDENGVIAAACAVESDLPLEVTSYFESSVADDSVSIARTLVSNLATVSMSDEVPTITNFCSVTAYPFTVVKAGRGSGSVTSNTGVISCGTTCTDNYASGTAVTLTATPASGSQFTGWLGGAAVGSQFATWQGACTGTGTCQSTIGGPTAALATFAPTAIGVPSLDIDGSTRSVALTDGLLVLRSLLGLSGASLVNGATGLGATRTSGAQVGDYLTDVKPILDVDGNGQVDVATDGLLVIRYLFGLRGGNLIAGAVGPGATRTTNTAIEAYIQALTRP